MKYIANCFDLDNNVKEVKVEAKDVKEAQEKVEKIWGGNYFLKAQK